MNIFGKKVPRDTKADGADQTAPGVRALKELWNIRTDKAVVTVSADVPTDIYSVAPRSSSIPRRHRPQRPNELR